ncbi:MAG TPA: hypothetical protein VGR16_14120 [Thermomicrobiales bacterium]|nr:hypothetical protein [Thermomicrobiales bacterium]
MTAGTLTWVRLAPFAAVVGLLALLVGSSTPGSAHAIATAHIHRGPCDEINGEGAIDLGELTYVVPLSGSPEATPAGPYRPVGVDSAFVTIMAVTDVGASLDELLAQPHSIDVHIVNDETGEEIPLACGNVGGVRNGDDLVFGLQTAPSPGVDTTGIAWLHTNPDGTTTVRLFVSQGLGTAPEGARTGSRAQGTPGS